MTGRGGGGSVGAMKLKDLPKNQPLGGVRFRHPDGDIYFWHSQWQKGVWGKKSLTDEQVFPLHVDNLSDALEWEVAEGAK